MDSKREANEEQASHHQAHPVFIRTTTGTMSHQTNISPHICSYDRATGTCGACTVPQDNPPIQKRSTAKSLTKRACSCVPVPSPPLPPTLPVSAQPGLLAPPLPNKQDPLAMIANLPVENKTADEKNGFEKLLKSSLRRDITKTQWRREVDLRFDVVPENGSVGLLSTATGSKKNNCRGTMPHMSDVEQNSQQILTEQNAFHNPDQSFERKAKLAMNFEGDEMKSDDPKIISTEIEYEFPRAGTVCLSEKKQNAFQSQLQGNTEFGTKEPKLGSTKNQYTTDRYATTFQFTQKGTSKNIQPVASSTVQGQHFSSKSGTSRCLTTSAENENVGCESPQRRQLTLSPDGLCSDALETSPLAPIRPPTAQFDTGQLNKCTDNAGDSGPPASAALPVLSHVALSPDSMETKSMNLSLVNILSCLKRQLQEQQDEIKCLRSDLQSLSEERGSVIFRVPDCYDVEQLPSSNKSISLSLKKKVDLKQLLNPAHREQESMTEAETHNHEFQHASQPLLLKAQSTSLVIEIVNGDNILRTKSYSPTQNDATKAAELQGKNIKRGKKRAIEAETAQSPQGNTSGPIAKRQKSGETYEDAQPRTNLVIDSELHAEKMAVFDEAVQKLELLSKSQKQNDSQNVPDSGIILDSSGKLDREDTFENRTRLDTDTQKPVEKFNGSMCQGPSGTVGVTQPDRKPHDGLCCKHSGTSSDNKPDSGIECLAEVFVRPGEEQNQNTAEQDIQQTSEMTSRKDALGSTGGSRVCKGNVSRGKRQRTTQGKRRRDNWTVEENDVFVNIVTENQGMEEMALRRMLAKRFSPRRTHEQCANHLRIMRTQGRLPQPSSNAVSLPRSQPGTQNARSERGHDVANGKSEAAAPF